MKSYINVGVTFAGLMLMLFSTTVPVEPITTTTSSPQGNSLAHSHDVLTPPQGRRLPPGRNPFPRPIPLDLPSIVAFTAATDCTAPDPARSILSYRVSPGLGGSRIQRVRINALHADDSIRVIYEESAPPGKPWAEASDAGIRDPAPNTDTIAYVLAVWNSKGAAVSRRLRFGYKLPLRFTTFSDYVGVGVNSERGYWFFIHFRGENIRTITVSRDAPTPSVPCSLEYRSDGLGTADCTPFFSTRRASAGLSFTFRAYGYGASHCPEDVIQRFGILPETPDRDREGSSGSGGSGSGSGSGTPHLPMEVCRGSAVPSGYIKVNDEWAPTRCGNPTSITYNVWILHYYADLPVGRTMEVCTDAATPSGWTEAGRRWDGTRCGHPTSSSTNNVKTIRRDR